MRWLVGFSLRGHCHGAASFATWIARQERPPAPVYGVHLLRSQGPFSLAQRAMEELADDLGGRDRYEELRTVETNNVATSATAACTAYDVDGLILGQRPSRRARPGPFTRTMLRTLPCPVAVAPYDWTPACVGTGPIVVAVDRTPAAVVAVAFADALSTALARPLRLCHVSGRCTVEDANLTWPSSPTHGTGAVTRAQTALSSFLGHDPPPPIPAHIVARNLTRHATKLDAPILIVGSRHRHRVARFFRPGVASNLTAITPMPLFIVPRPEPSGT